MLLYPLIDAVDHNASEKQCKAKNNRGHSKNCDQLSVMPTNDHAPNGRANASDRAKVNDNSD
jgi:hypothetical protein